MTNNRRLIELSIPLDAISAQSAREKSIRHGHISTLHIWWARRPLAACRAAVFAALVDAPDDPTERERLERLIATIVDWDQVKHGNSAAIEEARRIIRQQWDGKTPHVLHRACLLWNQGDRPGLTEFLARSGHARDESLWTVAQALSEILPDGDKEKQMLQGLLAGKERVVAEVRRERLL